MFVIWLHAMPYPREDLNTGLLNESFIAESKSRNISLWDIARSPTYG